VTATATVTTIDGLLDLLNAHDVHPPWNMRPAARAARESYVAVGLVDERVAGFVVAVDMAVRDASPAGWWIAYAWTAEHARGAGLGTVLLLDVFAQFEGRTPPAVARPAKTRGGDHLPWARRFGYRQDQRPWRFLDVSARSGYRLYTATGSPDWYRTVASLRGAP
jgi:GNAT superfamily N-acetyltransferase